MAKVISSYSGVMKNTDYIFDRPDVTGEKTQYPYGTELRLPANYGERETNGYYPVISPENGWINFMTAAVQIGAPNYTTVTDACTAPTSLLIEGKTLTIVGGAGGDLNTLTGFGVSWRERSTTGTEWGAWSADTVTSSRTVSVTVNEGKVRQYRARTMGSAGAQYYSAYTVCSALVNGNTAAKEPTVMLPTMDAVSISQTPVVVVNCSADAEGDAMTLMRSIDGGEWATAADVAGGGGTVYDRLPAQGNGRHTIAYKVADKNGAESGEMSVAIVVNKGEWTRSIASGDIISNREISHVADIHEMLYAVNIQRLYYGLPSITLPGDVGLYRDWGMQMQAMLDAVNASLAAAGQPITASEVSAVWPNAATINTIRERVVMV